MSECSGWAGQRDTDKSPIRAMAFNLLIATASNLTAMASNLIATASNLIATASNLMAMASKLR